MKMATDLFAMTESPLASASSTACHLPIIQHPEQIESDMCTDVRLVRPVPSQALPCDPAMRIDLNMSMQVPRYLEPNYGTAPYACPGPEPADHHRLLFEPRPVHNDYSNIQRYPYPVNEYGGVGSRDAPPPLYHYEAFLRPRLPPVYPKPVYAPNRPHCQGHVNFGYPRPRDRAGPFVPPKTYEFGSEPIPIVGGQLAADANRLSFSRDGDVKVDRRKNAVCPKYHCSLCNKQYCRKSTLKAHLRQHNGVRPYTCVVCNKSFSQAANLTAHRRVHTGEKPFSCPICCRPFSQSSSLVTHKRTHTGEKPYGCNQCDKSFTDSSTLTKHLRTHTGHKPYQCGICQLSFSQSGNLNRHMKTHARETDINQLKIPE